ncbi:phosphate butyryltransferase [Tepidibacillus infernus]|uniref:Phosphate butyryltransferase n=1 Tax=Tepidibacillus decaturensis TaxID=1413211 RepID=A0A135L330_9BACI|nr:phosphate butyryltransferase [Tepidibacillus decaturensis]KXG43307.1 phosphate butyryltransferase [Tepidibacillus decaturensis]
MNSFKKIISKIKRDALPQVAVAVAEDEEVLIAVQNALEKGFARFHLFGDESKIRQLAEKSMIPLDQVKITDERDHVKASLKAVNSVNTGESQILMKGLVPTPIILKAVLDKEIGLRTHRILSHIALFEVEGLDRLIFLTDAAMNISPSLEQKVQITQNAIDFARIIGLTEPKVAVLTALETVNPNMIATLDAALLSKMAERGQISGGIVDGPLALDNAISLEAAMHKGIKSKIAGQADILLVPNIEVGNTLYKSLVYFGKVKVGAVITGAKSPIVLTSRADSFETKLNSIALAVLLSQQANI